MGYPDIMLFIQGMGKMLYEPFRFTMTDFNRAPTPQSVAVFLWTAVIGYFRNEISSLSLEYVSSGLFLLSLLSIMWTEYLMSSTRTDRLFNKIFMKELINVVMYITLPVVLLFYAWFPIYDRLPCMMRRIFKDAISVDEWRSTTWVIFAAFLFLSALYGMIQGLKKPYKFRRSSKFSSPEVHTPVTRSMTKRMRYR